MEIFKEPIDHQIPVLSIKVWQFEHSVQSLSKTAPIHSMRQGKTPRWHYHKEVEFVFAKQGAHEIITPNHAYTLDEGDVVVIGSSQLHRGGGIGNYGIFIVLHVDLELFCDPAMMRYYRYFSELHNPLEELNYIFRENPVVRSEAGFIIEQIHEEIMKQSTGYEIAASMHMKHLLLILLRGDARGLLQAHDVFDIRTLKPILDYIDQHLSEKMDLEQISHIANMSYSYFSKFFKRTMGISFTEYINRKRIARAEQLLVTSELNVGEIARAIGFENMAHFYELFKRFNSCTPKQYLRQASETNWRK
ncbi:MAG: transcriptional regulator, AraC family [Paenibacillus sp.]|nr:transcriptional regulator, AraC family [Paenibacillus sp.]